jgi:serine protease AprX
MYGTMKNNFRFYVQAVILLLAGLCQLQPSIALHAYPSGSQQGAYYWVGFTDKLDSPYSTERPEEYLSPRAISRRHRQGIRTNEADLPVNQSYLGSLATDIHVQVVYTSRWFNGALVKAMEESSVDRIRQFSFVDEVILVKPDPGWNKAGGSPPRPERDKLSVEYGDYGEAYRQIEQLNGHYLHEEGYRGRGMHIAVLDAGFRQVDQLWVFEGLRSEGRLLGVKDFVEPGGNVFQAHTHGMAVLSVMAANDPGQLVGTAPEASYWLLRTEDVVSEYRIEEYNWLVAAEFADSAGVDIINSSLGYTRFDDPMQDYSYAQLNGLTTVVSRAANKAFERGMLVVNSAGNYGAQDWQYIGAPADAFGVLAVGAVDENGVRTNWSSLGPTADGRIKPDVMAMGLRVNAANQHNGISQVNGTSFSSPLVAGMAACLWQRFPDLHAGDIRELIVRSADRFRHADHYYGNGIPDFALASGIALASLEQQGFALVPNPLTSYSAIDFYSDSHTRMEVQLVNMKGEIVYRTTDIQVRRGINSVRPFSGISHLPQGVYLVRLLGDGLHHSLKTIFIN